MGKEGCTQATGQGDYHEYLAPASITETVARGLQRRRRGAEAVQELFGRGCELGDRTRQDECGLIADDKGVPAAVPAPEDGAKSLSH